MTSARQTRPALVLSQLDLPAGLDLLVHGCEDCACAVSDDQRPHRPPAPAARPGTRWIRGREIVELPLGPDHHVLFNPVGHGGAVVVDQAGRQLLHRFDQPAVFPAAGADDHAALARLAELELLHPDGQIQRPDFQAGQVLTAWLHVTNACNLRCPYCYVHKSADQMDEATGRAAVEAVIGSAVANGFPAVKLKYAGGEASLNHRLLVSLHEHARTLAARHGLELYATLLSNGVRLPGSLVETLKEAAIRVMISLDGLGEQHDAQRPFANGRPSFHLVDKTIGQLIEAGHPPHLSVTITSRNASGVADVVRFALERELTFSLNFFRDNDCAGSFPDLQYAEQSMISALFDTFGVIREFLPAWSVLGSVLDRGQLLQPRQRSCGVGQDYLVIDQHGQVAKCHMELERTLGSVFSGDPLQLIRQDQRETQNLMADEKEGCRDCTWRYWCSGGCAVATFRATGRYDIKSPNCNIYKAIYPEALKLEGLRLLKHATTDRPLAG
jgi:uncharacterized protein